MTAVAPLTAPSPHCAIEDGYVLPAGPVPYGGERVRAIGEFLVHLIDAHWGGRRDKLDFSTAVILAEHDVGPRLDPPADRAEIVNLMTGAWSDAAVGLTRRGVALTDVVATLRLVGSAEEPSGSDDWLIRDLIRPGSIAILGAVEGLGKSNVRLEIALVGAGGDADTPALLGQYRPTRQFRVLLVDEDNGEPEEWRREEAMLVGLALPRAALGNRYASMHFAGANLFTPEGQALLVSAVAQHRPDLTILDTGGVMTAEEWGEAFKVSWAFLRQLAMTHGTAVLVVVHVVKPPRDRRPTPGSAPPVRTISDVMGQWTRHADVVVVMSPTNDEGTRAQVSVGKRVPRASFVVGQQDGRWVKVADVSPFAAKRRDMAVLRLLSSSMKGAAPADLAAAVGVKDRALTKYIAGLRADGYLGPEYPYRVTPEGLEALADDEEAGA